MCAAALERMYAFRTECHPAPWPDHHHSRTPTFPRTAGQQKHGGSTARPLRPNDGRAARFARSTPHQSSAGGPPAPPRHVPLPQTERAPQRRTPNRYASLRSPNGKSASYAHTRSPWKSRRPAPAGGEHRDRPRRPGCVGEQPEGDAGEARCRAARTARRTEGGTGAERTPAMAGLDGCGRPLGTPACRWRASVGLRAARRGRHGHGHGHGHGQRAPAAGRRVTAGRKREGNRRVSGSSRPPQRHSARGSPTAPARSPVKGEQHRHRPAVGVQARDHGGSVQADQNSCRGAGSGFVRNQPVLCESPSVGSTGQSPVSTRTRRASWKFLGGLVGRFFLWSRAGCRGAAGGGGAGCR